MKYSVKCAVLRTNMWIATKPRSVRCGIKPNRMGRNTPPVCSVENASVDNEKISAAQHSAGSHASTNLSWYGV